MGIRLKILKMWNTRGLKQTNIKGMLTAMCSHFSAFYIFIFLFDCIQFVLFFILIYFATNFLDKFLFPSKNRKNFLLSILKFIIRGLYWMPDTPSKLFWFSNRCQMKFCFFIVRHNQTPHIYKWLLE